MWQKRGNLTNYWFDDEIMKLSDKDYVEIWHYKESDDDFYKGWAFDMSINGMYFSKAGFNSNEEIKKAVRDLVNNITSTLALV